MPLPASLRLLIAAAALAVLARPVPAPAQGAAVSLASHRAVYDLKLSTTRGKRAMNAVRGRILYDFSGSACEGYALQFRQVSELDSGEGKVIVSDLRATSWEDGGGKRLRFHSQNYFDEALRDSVDGLPIVCDIQGRFLRVMDMPEDNGVHIDRDRILGKCLLGAEGGGLYSLVDDCRHVVEDGDNEKQAGSFDTLQLPRTQDHELLPSVGHLE